MKNTILKLFYIINLCALATLTGCGEPMSFGMPTSQFNTLTPDQQNQVVDGYNQRQIIAEQNRPLTSMIGSIGAIGAIAGLLNHSSGQTNEAFVPSQSSSFNEQDSSSSESHASASSPVDTYNMLNPGNPAKF